MDNRAETASTKATTACDHSVHGRLMSPAALTLSTANRPIGQPQQLNRRRDQARHLSIGAPITASFIGLMLIDQSLNGAWAVEAAETGTGLAEPSAPALFTADDHEQANEVDFLAAEQPATVLSAQATTLDIGTIQSSAALVASGSEIQTSLRQASDAQMQSTASIEQANTTDFGQTTIVSAASDSDGTTDLNVYPDEDLGTVGSRVEGGDGDDVITGTEDNDVLLGNGGDDQISGLGGDDFIDGGSGNDVIDGGEGDDTLIGGTGDDVIFGSAGDDGVDGGAGDDQINGGSGSDDLSGGSGDDRVDGGTGSDSLRGDGGDDVLVIDNYGDFTREESFGADGGGVDTLEVTQGYSDSLAARLPGLVPEGIATFVLGGTVGRSLPGEANDFVQQVDPQIENLHLIGDAWHDVIGGGDDNELFGNDGSNRLWGDSGNDRLAGGDGDDFLFGGAGDDLIGGEDGEDFLFGESGDDTFLFGLSDSGVDTVFDHEGSNQLKVDSADATQLNARFDGDDLLLAYGEQDFVRIQDYAGHEEAFANVETADGDQRSLADLVVTPAADGDILSTFLSSESGAGQALETSVADSIETVSGVGSDQVAGDLLQAFMSTTDPFTGELGEDTGYEAPIREATA